MFRREELSPLAQGVVQTLPRTNLVAGEPILRELGNIVDRKRVVMHAAKKPQQKA
jgi:hypothetical protein